MPHLRPALLVLGGLFAFAIVLLPSGPLQAASGDENWEAPNLALPLTGGYVQSLAVFKGELYAAGYILKAGGVWATNLARWNGTNWAPALGLADSSYVASMAAGDRYLFLSGNLTLAGATNRIPLVGWDGTNATVFENGPLQVNGMAASGGALYIAGWFTNAATGLEGLDVQQWDGTNWFSIASHDAGSIYSMAVRGNELFVAGYFSSIGGTPATNIARWDGTNWSALGQGLGDIQPRYAKPSLFAIGTALYLGTGFQTVGGKAITNVARWDGTNWWPMGGNSAVYVLAFAELNGTLYAAGKFEAIGGVQATNIAQWDGTNWSAVGGGLLNAQATVLDLAVRNGQLYAAGSFTRAGEKLVNSIAKWDGTNWSSLGEGIVVTGSLVPLGVVSNTVYAGGAFLNVGGVSAANIASWKGTNWFALREGADDYVYAGVTLSNQLYIGGNFLNVDGISAAHVARWNGTNWFGLGNGVDFPVNGMTLFSNTIIVAGAITSPTAVTNPVARWNGTDWTRLASVNGSVVLQGVRALAANTNRLFAIADISADGTNTSDTVVEWDGSNWSNIGDSRYYYSCLTVYLNNLYAGTAGGDLVSQWTGTNWITAALSPAFGSSFALTIAILGGDIYLGGYGFYSPRVERTTGLSASGIARWDGLEWSFLGSGIEGQVHSLLASGTNVYASGSIRQAGSKPAMGFAIWNEPPPEPELRIYSASNAVQVVWPNALTNYFLQTQTNQIGTNWIPFQQSPIVTGSRSVVTNLSTGEDRFFRLRVR